MYICTPEQMRAAEANSVSTGQSYIGLMENAGRALYEEILLRCPEIRTGKGLILCGKGNNGGDGFVLARLLAEAGADITVLLVCGEPESSVARTEFERLSGYPSIAVTRIGKAKLCDEYCLICDAVFGTGFHGSLPDEIKNLFEIIGAFSAFKTAADIPSGADSLSGSVCGGVIRCDLTVTFGAVKLGMTLSPAREYCGEAVTADIGITDECFEAVGFVPRLLDKSTAAAAIPPRNEHSHKGHFGRLLIVGGSRDMSGAAALNAMGALRSGAGLVRLASTRTVADRVGALLPECTFLELSENSEGAVSIKSIDDILAAVKECSVAAAGSGLTVCEDTRVIIRELIGYCGKNNIPLILDADGLNCIGSSIDIIRNANCKAVLTPHPKELSRLLGISPSEVLSDRLAAARTLAVKSGAIVAAKGTPTFIVSPCGRACASYTGNGGLSRGGSGDVLTGIISGIAASNKGERLFESVCAGVYIFGLAADLAAERFSMTGMLPSDAAAQLPFAFKLIENGQSG